MSRASISAAFDRSFAQRRAFRTKSSPMTKWLEKHKSLLIFGGLIVAGVALHFWHLELPDKWEWVNETRELLGHAFIVAGLLGGTVDTILKAELIRDVGSIFVGWALPQEVRNYIRTVSQTALVRRNYAIHYTLREDGEDVVVDVTHDSDVYNYSAGIKTYRTSMAVDRFENPDEEAIELEITRGSATHHWKGAQLSQSKRCQKTDQLIRWHSPKQLILLPQDLGDTAPGCHVRWRHRIRVPRNFSTVAAFGTPSIGVTITWDCPTGGLELEVKATDDAIHAKGSNRWFDSSLFYGSHVRVYWRPK
jgi:hypothetical protein